MPFRKCIGCGTVKDRTVMIRIMKLHDTGEVIIQPTPEHFGRSFYICYNIECVDKVLKKKKLQKILKREIPAAITNYLNAVGQ